MTKNLEILLKYFLSILRTEKVPPLLKYDISVQLSSEKDMLELRHFFWMCGKFRYVHTTGTEISTREKNIFEKPQKNLSRI